MHNLLKKIILKKDTENVLKTKKCALCFSIYSDDVEFANGICPNRGKNK